MFYRHPTLYSATIVAVLTLYGAGVFMYPQWVLGKVISRAHDRACRIIIDAYAIEKETSLSPPATEAEQAKGLGEFLAGAAPPKIWVYGVDTFLQWGGVQIVATLALVL
jgi:hypothetical protein